MSAAVACPHRARRRPAHAGSGQAAGGPQAAARPGAAADLAAGVAGQRQRPARGSDNVTTSLAELECITGLHAMD